MSSGGGKGLTSLLGLAGAGSNIYSGIEQSQQANRLAHAQQYVADLVQNPKKMTAAAAGYTQPLTAGLTADVENEVQANLAERGLGSSPAAYTQQLTQALAPFIMANKQAGFNHLLQALQLPSGFRSFAPPFTNLSGILKQLQMPSAAPAAPAESDPYANLDPFANNDPFDPFAGGWGGILPGEAGD